MNAVQIDNSLFTPQETRVLILIAKGYSSEDISKLLKINKCTVHSHLKAVRRKTGISSCVLLGFYALGKGLVTQDEIKIAIRREQREASKRHDT